MLACGVGLSSVLAQSITADELEALKQRAPIHPEVKKHGVNADPRSRDLFRKYVTYVRMVKPANAAAARSRLLGWVDEDIRIAERIMESSSPRSKATKSQYRAAEIDHHWLVKFRAWCEQLPKDRT